MPAKSKEQAIAARMALAAHRGEIPVSELSHDARRMYEGMEPKELEHFTTFEDEDDESNNGDEDPELSLEKTLAGESNHDSD